MTELGLDGIKLITKGQVVFVTLLYFEDFRLQLTDQEIFLIGCEVNTVVILNDNVGNVIDQLRLTLDISL